MNSTGKQWKQHPWVPTGKGKASDVPRSGPCHCCSTLGVGLFSISCLGWFVEGGRVSGAITGLFHDNSCYTTGQGTNLRILLDAKYIGLGYAGSG